MRRPQHLQHQRRRLAGVQAVADDEAAVVVHEGDQVDPPVLPLEDEREQVGLPQLIRAGPLEASGPCRDAAASATSSQLVAGLVQHPGHGRGAGGQGRAAQQHVADALAAPVRVGLLEHEDGAPGQLGQRLPAACPAWLSISPAGPSASNRFFQAYRVCLDSPTRAAKSPAGNRCAARCPGAAAAARRSRSPAWPSPAARADGRADRLPTPGQRRQTLDADFLRRRTFHSLVHRR